MMKVLRNVKSTFQNIESFLRTMPTEEDYINFFQQKYFSNFETFEILLCVFDISDIHNIWNNLLEP